jgi:hypothetical protein
MRRYYTLGSSYTPETTTTDKVKSKEEQNESGEQSDAVESERADSYDGAGAEESRAAS